MDLKENKDLVAKAVLILAMLALMVWQKGSAASISIAVSVIVVVVLLSFYRKKHPEKYKKDERTRKIGAVAASWSWVLTFLLATFMYWFDYLDIYKFSGTAAISIIFVFMAATVIIFRWYFWQKGDVEWKQD